MHYVYLGYEDVLHRREWIIRILHLITARKKLFIEEEEYSYSLKMRNSPFSPSYHGHEEGLHRRERILLTLSRGRILRIPFRRLNTLGCWKWDDMKGNIPCHCAYLDYEVSIHMRKGIVRTLSRGGILHTLIPSSVIIYNFARWI